MKTATKTALAVVAIIAFRWVKCAKQQTHMAHDWQDGETVRRCPGHVVMASAPEAGRND